MHNGTLLAAVDLGSNSFRLELGQVVEGQIERTEYLKEIVRLGNGFDVDRNLSAAAMRRGWDCLARFGERLGGFQRVQVRAVATQTLREARNRDIFLEKGQLLLGFPIEVIAGREEARLIYQGVAHSLPQTEERRLVIDIGGRSTEVVLGQAYTATVMESYRVGSVAWSMRYFADGRFTNSAFRVAEIAAKAVLDEAVSQFPRDTWQLAYGASGTVGAVADALAGAGWQRNEITQEGLDWLQDRLIKAGSVDKLRLEGIKEDRKAVIGGGLAILRALFELLDISHMFAAEGALRQGALYDLLDREHSNTDIRSQTVRRLAAKFGVDSAQAQRVATVALSLFQQVCEPPCCARALAKLEWAAQLHEIGSLISHSDFHIHGAYLLANADAPGFATPELQRLANLVLGHRGKLRKLDIDFDDDVFVCQLLCLRLAALLCHARREPDITDLALYKEGRSFEVCCTDEWVAAFPQSAYLLQAEEEAWQRLGWSFHMVCGVQTE